MNEIHYRDRDFKDFILKRIKGKELLKFYEHIQECNQCLNSLRNKVLTNDEEVEKDVTVDQQRSTV